jgi:hypothetical protein
MDARELFDIICLGATAGCGVRLLGGFHVALDRAAILGIAAAYLLRAAPGLETVTEVVPAHALNVAVLLFLISAGSRLLRRIGYRSVDKLAAGAPAPYRPISACRMPRSKLRVGSRPTIGGPPGRRVSLLT